MSWFSFPLPNPFKSLEHSDDEQESPRNDVVSPGGGVKKDLSAIGDSIGRQFRGVAAFLAPPAPESEDSGAGAGDGDGGSPSSRTFSGIRSDLAEIGRAVTEISKLASNFLQLNEEDDEHVNSNGDDADDDDDDGVGITDEVIEFATQISNRPELWTDFPLSLDHEFDMSDAQSEHTSIIEQLVPSLADLRSRISSNINDMQFWMIYFILLLPRLNEYDLELLSAPEIVEVRETLLLMLRSNKDTEINSEKPQSDSSSGLDDKVNNLPMERIQSGEKVMTSENSDASRSMESTESDSTKKLLQAEDHKQSDVKAGNSNVGSSTKEHEIIDYWEEDEETVTTGTSAAAPKQFQSEDDVSFSDLEDDDSDLPNRQYGSGRSQLTRTSSPEGSNDWIRLNENVGTRGSHVRGQSSLQDTNSEGEESGDWLTVDDFDSQ